MAFNFTAVQADISNTIEKAFVNYKKSPKDRITLSYVETRLEVLEEKWKIFDENHRKIVLEVNSEELSKSSYCVNNVYDKTEETYIEYKSKLKEALLRLKPQPTRFYSEVKKSSEHSVVKLPKISIPQFSGKYSEWASFRDLFSSLIHKNHSIDDVQRLHYLKSSLTGEAAQLIQHIPITADNYRICWNQLENRYNNKKYLSNQILKRLMGQKAVTHESASGLKLLLDTTKECLHAMGYYCDFYSEPKTRS